VAVAEDFLSQDKYDEAAKNYRKAFKSKDFMFDFDLQNATYCEVMSKKPSKAQCLLYSAQYGYNVYTKYKDFKNIDSTFFANYKKTQHLDNKILQEIRQMLDKDKQYRTNYNPKDTLMGMQMLSADRTNFIHFKNMLDTVNLFDERVISFDEISIFINHWSVNSLSVADFLPLMQKSIDEGVMDARNFASDVGDVLAWRANPRNPFHPYGTKLLSIYQTTCEERDMSKRKYIAFFNFDKNDKEVKKKLKEIDKKRKAIYLGGVYESNIRDFKFWLKVYAYNQDLWEYLFAHPQALMCSTKGKETLEKQLELYPDLNYYITGEHNDFNTK
jgi:hypothetical protein